MSIRPLSAYNVCYQLQQDICDVINQSPVLLSAGIEFIAEDSQSVDYQIKESLKKQGIACVVMTPSLQYLGHNGGTEAFQIDDFTVQIVEYTPINRAKNRNIVCTGIDLANYTSELLGGPNAVIGFGKLCPKGIEQAEEEGLLVTKLTFSTYIENGPGPIIYIPYVTRDEMEAYVGDGKLTFTKDGEAVAEFTANQKAGLSVEVGSSSKGLPTGILKRASYLYDLQYVETDEKEAMKLFEQYKPEPAACTSIREGDVWARNYDWSLDESPAFVVKLPGIPGRRLASVSICRGMSSITQSRVDSRDLTEQEWKTIPYFALDGFNERGVVCNINVLSKKDDEPWEGDEYCAIMAVRKVLDNARTAAEGAQMIASEAWLPEYDDYSFHFMVCDKSSTWIVEDGVATDITSSSKKIMANFRICDGEFETGGLADPSKIAEFDPYGTGVERWNILAQNGISAIYEDFFTKAYLSSTFPARVTEFSSKSEDIKINDSAALQDKLDDAIAAWPSHTRDGTFWQTVHSSEYDFDKKTFKLVVQEDTSKTFFYKIGECINLRWGSIEGDIEDQSDLAAKLNEKASQEQVDGIEEKIPNAATSENQLADKAFVNSSINNYAAFYLTKNANGDAFGTYAELSSATKFYNAGVEKAPTKNDYLVVLEDETKTTALSVDPTTRYTYQGEWPTGQFEFQYIVNNTALTQAQVDAINSGITKDIVDSRVIPSEYYKGYAANADTANTALNTAMAAYAQGAYDDGVRFTWYELIQHYVDLSPYALSSDVRNNYTPLALFNQVLGNYSDTLLSGLTEDDTPVSFYILTKNA